MSLGAGVIDTALCSMHVRGAIIPTKVRAGFPGEAEKKHFPREKSQERGLPLWRGTLWVGLSFC